MVLAAYVFVVLAVVIGAFQVALALGAPLGEYTLGGKFPGKLPQGMRAAALVQLVILFIFVVIVMAKAGIAFEQFHSGAKIGAWIVAVFFALGTVMNMSSPSPKEKRIMGPANIIAFVTTLIVALG